MTPNDVVADRNPNGHRKRFASLAEIPRYAIHWPILTLGASPQSESWQLTKTTVNRLMKFSSSPPSSMLPNPPRLPQPNVPVLFASS